MLTFTQNVLHCLIDYLPTKQKHCESQAREAQTRISQRKGACEDEDAEETEAERARRSSYEPHWPVRRGLGYSYQQLTQWIAREKICPSKRMHKWQSMHILTMKH